ncbi:MAG: methyl-accepting chemotaxis sensory transducer [Fibrobacteres bacterium]|nr:methyl-accepting chemotaxis sensory transducer [Fibrobacterota bacterium]
MLKGASLSTKLYLGFASVLVIVGALGIFAFSRLYEIKGFTAGIVNDNIPGIYNIGKLEALVRRNLILAGKHVLANGDKSEIEKIEADYADNRKAVTDILGTYEKTVSNPKERELFDAIGPLRETFASVLNNQVLPLSRAGKVKEAKEVLDGTFETAYEKYLDAVLTLVDYNKDSGEDAGAEITAAVKQATAGIIIGLLAAIAIGAAIGIFLSRSISAALNQVINSLASGSEQVSSASNQVSQSSQQMAEGASEQASSLEETSASLEEMSSMTRQNTDNAKQANIMATETRGAVEKSRVAMTRMGEAITKIKASSDQTAKIIKTIDEIAFQTNLLALNAAVEAARAGDAGKGFAVVAEEVRNLAQRSAEAAKSTASLIEESQQNANNGVAVSNEVAGILSQIVESVQKLTQIIGEVSSASEEQSKGIGQIGTAVTQMDKLTQSNASNAEESASASEELFAQAKELTEMVSILVGIVKGAGAAQIRNLTPQGAGHGAPNRGRTAASMISKPAAKAAKRNIGFGQDWTAKPAGKNGVNGHHKTIVASTIRVASPDEVIPLDDSELKDF